MRRDKTLKVCANHISESVIRSSRAKMCRAKLGSMPSCHAKEGEKLTIVSPEMHLSPNVGSDRSWVWNVAADFAEGSDHTNETLAIRFGNSESESNQL